jgi:hypothetical protein
MGALLQIDFRSPFVPSVHLAEVVMRGTFVYLLLFTILRILRREAGTVGIADFLWWCSLPMRRRTQWRVQIDHGRRCSHWHHRCVGLFAGLN